MSTEVKKPSRVSITLIHRLFQKVTAADALIILCQLFGVSTSVVYIEGRRFQLVELLDDCYMFYGALASEIEVRFYGGPPAKGNWFNGTLLTLIMDHAAYQVARGHCEKISEALRWMGGRGTLTTQ